MCNDNIWTQTEGGRQGGGVQAAPGQQQSHQHQHLQPRAIMHSEGHQQSRKCFYNTIYDIM